MTASSVATFFECGDISMRKLQDSDTPSVVSLINRAYAYQDELRGETRTDPARLWDKAHETDFYVFARGDEIVGCVYVEPKGDQRTYFGLFTLAESVRGNGVGSAAMRAIEAYAYSVNARALRLGYMADIAAGLQPYYERYGFTLTGEFEWWGKVRILYMEKSLERSNADA